MKTLRMIVLLSIVSSVAFGQWNPGEQAAAVSQVDFPPSVGVQMRIDASNSNTVLVCYAKSVQSPDSVSVAPFSVTAAKGSVTTLTGAFGLYSTASPAPKPLVTISGATGTSAVLNGTWTATMTGTTTATVPVDTSGISGSITGALTVVTFAPRLSQPVWSVKVIITSGSNTSIFWGGGASYHFDQICALPSQYQ